MAYGNTVKLAEQFRQAATYVDRILKGAKPSDLPVQGADRYGLIINLRTAKALGLTVPLALSGQADEVIEETGSLPLSGHSRPGRGEVKRPAHVKRKPSRLS